MRTIFFRVLALSFCATVLVACKPADKKATASSPAASATANALLPSFSGEYAMLAVPQPAMQGNKVEVLEFFGYFCSHCKTFDPAVTAWAKKNRNKVAFTRVPVAFRNDLIAQQRMYYTLEAMGLLDSLHEQIFHAVQNERLSLSNDKEILAYVTQQGVNAAKFQEHYHSAAVQTQMAQAQKRLAAYDVQSVPLFAIDGRYIASATYASKRPGIEQTERGVQNATLAIMDDLVAKTLSERGAKK
ncbi:MAG: thiol:disulfide interchange protein DsbA/DsbL [Oxalobacter sp.]|nr:MAG: thiol:disulfide interchange protein DsbA/DsbL [Oxalobacter sp.]